MFIQSRRFSRFIFLIIIVSYLCLPALQVSAGEIYKWRDKQGRLHFSDTARDETTEVVKEIKYPEPVSSNHGDLPATESNSEDPGKTTEKLPPDVINIPYISKEGGATRIIVEVTFNDIVTAPMLLDTGAPGLVISVDLADRLNLFDKAGSQLLVNISGIGGSEVATRTIIDRVSIENISEDVIPAHIVSEMSDAYDGLIGMDVLSGYTLTIDPANEQLVAKEIPVSPDRPGGHYKSWWQGKFSEFRGHKEFWGYHATQVEKMSGTSYARMSPQNHERYKQFIFHQRDEADHLYRKLAFKASDSLVPTHWCK